MTHPLGIYYNQYRDIRQRMFNPKNKSYEYCHFLEFGFDCYRDFEIYIKTKVGPKPSNQHQLTRKDFNQGFIPGNLIWQSRKNIARKQRSIVKILYNKKEYCMVEFCEKYNFNYGKFRKKYRESSNLKEAMIYAKK